MEGSSLTASMVPIKPCVHRIGFGTPVVPEVCNMQNGSLMALSKALSNKNGSVDSASRSPSTLGSSRTLIYFSCKIPSTRGSIACSRGFTQILQSEALRTASAPVMLFLGERKRACLNSFSIVCTIMGSETTYSTAGLDSTIGQEHMPNVI